MKPQLSECGKFVKVRIPVAVQRDGRWLADGYSDRDHDRAIEAIEVEAAECLINPRISFVYALVPLPQYEVIAGEVETHTYGPSDEQRHAH